MITLMALLGAVTGGFAGVAINERKRAQKLEAAIRAANQEADSIHE